jgi:hypothetical protein
VLWQLCQKNLFHLTDFSEAASMPDNASYTICTEMAIIWHWLTSNFLYFSTQTGKGMFFALFKQSQK